MFLWLNYHNYDILIIMVVGGPHQTAPPGLWRAEPLSGVGVSGISAFHLSCHSAAAQHIQVFCMVHVHTCMHTHIYTNTNAHAHDPNLFVRFLVI